jgi:hypothetical protein
MVIWAAVGSLLTSADCSLIIHKGPQDRDGCAGRCGGMNNSKPRPPAGPPMTFGHMREVGRPAGKRMSGHGWAERY